MTETGQAIVTPSGSGPTYWTGFPNTIRVHGKDTDGAFTLIELRIPAGYTGVPHIHHNEHQTDHILRGELVFTVGDEEIVATAGTVVHCPKDVPHAFSNRTEEEAVVMDWLHPAGFDEFMMRSAPLLEDPDNPPEMDMSQAMELAPDYGLEFLPPEGGQPPQ